MREVWIGLILSLGLFLAVGVVWILVSPTSDIAFIVTVVEPVAIPVVWILGPRKHRVSLAALGLRPSARNAFGLGCATLAAIYLIAVSLTICLSFLGVGQNVAAVAAFESTRLPALLLVGGVLVAPFSEELLFRGFVFSGLHWTYGWKRAAFLSSLAFAAFHLDLPRFPALFAIGFLLSMLYYRTNSLWPGVIVHASVNAIGLIASLLLSQTGGAI